jgi:hypothetical protein
VCPRCGGWSRGDAFACRSLGCGDLVCEECARHLLSHNRIVCPCCSQVTPVPSGDISSLIIPRSLATLLRLSERRLAEADLEAVLTTTGTFCPVCLDPFGTPVVPMRLPCGHNVCQPCCTLLRSGMKGPETSCPECRTDMDMDTLVPNGALLHLIQELARLKETLPS